MSPSSNAADGSDAQCPKDIVGSTLLTDDNPTSGPLLASGSGSLPATPAEVLTGPAIPDTLPLPPQGGPPRPVCVLDLDGTLIASEEIASSSHFAGDRAPDYEYIGRRAWLRPGAREFLEALHGRFELVLFTAATQNWASTAVEYLGEQYFEYLLHREHTSSDLAWDYVKDLSRLGRDLARTVIVDDNPLMFMYQPHNALQVEPYEAAAAAAGTPDNVLQRVAEVLLEQVLPSLDVRDVLEPMATTKACIHNTAGAAGCPASHGCGAATGAGAGQLEHHQACGSAGCNAGTCGSCRGGVADTEADGECSALAMCCEEDVGAMEEDGEDGQRKQQEEQQVEAAERSWWSEAEEEEGNGAACDCEWGLAPDVVYPTNSMLPEEGPGAEGERADDPEGEACSLLLLAEAEADLDDLMTDALAAYDSDLEYDTGADRAAAGSDGPAAAVAAAEGREEELPCGLEAGDADVAGAGGCSSCGASGAEVGMLCGARTSDDASCCCRHYGSGAPADGAATEPAGEQSEVLAAVACAQALAGMKRPRCRPSCTDASGGEPKAPRLAAC